jgi:acyl carrier protein
MNKDDVIKILNNIFIEVLGTKDILLAENTTANDIDDWDSLNHIQLIVAIEKYFKIRFTSKEIQKWNNVGEMAESIISKNV